jgi:signal transduction histidine kinase
VISPVLTRTESNPPKWLPLLDPTAPPSRVGVAMMVLFIVVESALVRTLGMLEPAEHLGAVYLIGLLVIATFWPLWLAVLTSLLSAVAFDAVRAWGTGHFVPIEKHHLVMHAGMLLVAVVANWLARGARLRAEEADQRRREADLAAELARVMLGGVKLDSALELAAGRLAQVVQLPWVRIERGIVYAGDGRVAILLCDGDQVLGTLLAPRNSPPRTLRRLRERVVPGLEALLRAACDREAINAAIEDSNAVLTSLAEQQSALRRIATLVAHRVEPEEVFAAVVDEIARCLHAAGAALMRNRPDGDSTLVAAAGVINGIALPERGIQAPIMVSGAAWGFVTVVAPAESALLRGTAERVRDFADLAATAIANAAARQELTASRARIVAAADDARRRLERDLHDGAQQRLETLKLEVRLAEDSVPDGDDELRAQLQRIVTGLNGVSDDLHEFSRGIHPAVLASGLAAALRTLARRSAIPVTLDVDVAGRLPQSVEVAAYYVVAEALTNAAKHACADSVTASAHVAGDELHLMIADDGVGGANLDKGSGLTGLTDRVEAIGGRLVVVSPYGAGTSISVTLPLRVPGE